MASTVISSCIYRVEPGADVGGRAWLLTDGEQAVLQFELYTHASLGSFFPMIGQVQLGSLGVALAKQLVERAEHAEGLDQQGLRRLEFRDVEGARLVTEGQVDGLGRRQGMWTLKRENALLVELEWKDGVLDGVVATYGEDLALVSLSTYRMGFLHGAAFRWFPERGLSLRTWDLGVDTGESSWLHPNGMRAGEKRMEAAGTMVRTWDENGELLGEGLEDPSAAGYGRAQWKLERHAQHREVQVFRADHSH